MNFGRIPPVHPIAIPNGKERSPLKIAEDKPSGVDAFRSVKENFHLRELGVCEPIAGEALQSTRKRNVLFPRLSQLAVEKSLAGDSSTGFGGSQTISSECSPSSWGISTTQSFKITAAASASAPGPVTSRFWPSISRSLAPISTTPLSISAAKDSIQTLCVQPEVCATTEKIQGLFSDNPQEDIANLTAKCADIAFAKECSLNFKRYQLHVLRNDPSYKTASVEERKKMEDKFRGPGERVTCPGLGLMKKRMARDFEDQDAEHQVKRARKQPSSNELEEDGSDMEDTIVVKLPGFGIENGEETKRGSTAVGGKEEGGMDNVKRASKTNCNSKTIGKRIWTGKYLLRRRLPTMGV
ncbi:hypothetical protein RUND412_001374 [Rhizina undulata]